MNDFADKTSRIDWRALQLFEDENKRHIRAMKDE